MTTMPSDNGIFPYGYHPHPVPPLAFRDVNPQDEIDEDEDDEPRKRQRTATDDGERGRRKIQIEFIEDKSKRHITFSKRKAGIMKKAYELSTLTGTQVLLLVVSESGLVFTYTTSKLQPLVAKGGEGQKLIQACLNAPEGTMPSFSVSIPNAAPLPVPAPPVGTTESGAAVHGGQITQKARIPRVSPRIPGARSMASPNMDTGSAPDPQSSVKDLPGGATPNVDAQRQQQQQLHQQQLHQQQQQHKEQLQAQLNQQSLAHVSPQTPRPPSHAHASRQPSVSSPESIASATVTPPMPSTTAKFPLTPKAFQTQNGSPSPIASANIAKLQSPYVPNALARQIPDSLYSMPYYADTQNLEHLRAHVGHPLLSHSRQGSNQAILPQQPMSFVPRRQGSTDDGLLPYDQHQTNVLSSLPASDSYYASTAASFLQNNR